MISGQLDEQRLQRLERLRKLGVRKGTQHLARPQSIHAAEPLTDPNLPGEEIQTPFGPAWVYETRFPLHQHPALAAWLDVAPETLAALDRSELLLDLAPAGAVFIDTETTGLSLGTGTYTFLIGVGTYERAPERRAPIDDAEDPGDDLAFVVRQYFMRHPGEERAQLHLVEEAIGGASGIVSFNGRSFDMPLIHNRFILASMPPPLIGAPHLDLLHPARRLWKMRWGSCSLGNLERNVLGLERTTEDVPSYLIPDIYRTYYLTGVATEMLARVFYHNLQDVVSMALLGARMARHFRREAVEEQSDALDPLECVSLARCYDALGWVEASARCYRLALQRARAADQQVLALRELSLLYKRLEWREQAAELWEEWVSSVTGEDLTPYVELAKHHEWHTGNLPAARGWAAWALRIAGNWPPGLVRDEVLAQLSHRLARIERKLAGAATGDIEEDSNEG